LHLAAANTGRADAEPFASTVHQRVYRLQIDIPATVAHIVGVTDLMPKLWPTLTDFTNSCHKNTLPLNGLLTDKPLV